MPPAASGTALAHAARVTRVTAKVLGALTAVGFLLLAPQARAWTNCDEGCAIVADGIVAVGGVVTSAGMQVELIRGEPSKEWEIVGASFAGANVIGGGVLLILSALTDDDDTATALRVIGGTQLAIAAGNGVGVVVTELARENELVVPNSSSAAPTTAGITLGFSF
jgi:hypothetical protein